jgi:hypothetical protein
MSFTVIQDLIVNIAIEIEAETEEDALEKFLEMSLDERFGMADSTEVISEESEAVIQ